MRGDDTKQTTMFSYLSPEDRVPADHPLRIIRDMVDLILERLSPQFVALYARGPSVDRAREVVTGAVAASLYTIRSERQLMEQLDYNILYRWFVGLNLDDPVWVPTVFTKNRERLLKGDIATAFLAEVLQEAERRAWLSNEHFTVDGTLLEAWASHKSFQRKDGSSSGSKDHDPSNPTVNSREEKRSNATHGENACYRIGGNVSRN